MTTPWQLKIYEKSFKKKEKVAAIDHFTGDLNGKVCLEIGCDKGVTSYFLRKKGGWWVSADIDHENVKITNELIDDHPIWIDEKGLPFGDGVFDYVLAIDTLEHIEADGDFLKEIRRVVKDDGKICITVPCSDTKLFLNRIAGKIGMTKEYYGHKRTGYTVGTLGDLLKETDFSLMRHDYFSMPFTEGIELSINFLYVFVLNKGAMKKGIKGSISPVSDQDFNAHSMAFKLFTLIRPVFNAIIAAGNRLKFPLGYCLMVEARRADLKGHR